MIHVDRVQTDNAGDVVQPNAAWFGLAAERTSVALREQGDHEVDAEVYAHLEVRKALERLFCRKCAYCERRLESFDVDHFRPKGTVAERPDHPGYYWLTYTWSNLYPACEHCNRRRRDRPLWEDHVELPAAGKQDQFPLSDEGTRAMSPDDELDREQRLLVDPCIDNPEEYFGYDPFGDIVSVKEPQGSRTIEVFHLYRRRLKDFRREVVVYVSALVRLITKLRTRDAATTVLELTECLDRYKNAESEYAGVARFVANNPAAFGV